MTDVQDRIAAMTDKQLVEEYLKTDGIGGDPIEDQDSDALQWVEALARELERRNVDF
ncbi:hypothetical protein OKW76_00510 [Sphingomonas sp. S1-29]|uniref:hypothetical protein n=1 Tax=Sphingomonas sp. S1-29 TaxID=2991074 RepID=UPI00223EDD3A|nr:hypothetical protein [Sphingomonas sp. S1-29]UZK69607.1 hypothetical protein OKW76_00510 [Sphingomonas sp. S1-29]